MKTNYGIAFLFAIAATASAPGVLQAAEQQHPPVGYIDTPMLPGGKWHVHDSNRP